MLHMGIFLSGLKPDIISINISHKKVYFIEYKTHSYSTGLRKNSYPKDSGHLTCQHKTCAQGIS